MSGLLVERHGTVATWTLNRPEVRNALDEAVVAGMTDALAAGEASGTEVVILRGEGPSFCAGADLSLIASHDPARGQTPRHHLTAIWDLTLAMERSPISFVAVLQGHAIAGGLELALACDVVLAVEGTKIGDGHVQRSLLPGGGASARMARAFGSGTASWLALTGVVLPAEDAAFAGWLRAVVPAELMDSAVESVVASLVAVPSVARSSYKRLLREMQGGLTTADRDRELDAFDRHWLSNDVPSVLRTFLDKPRRAS